MSATSSSAGVSLQTPEDVMINSDFGGDSATASSKVDEENKGKCFYTLCEKSTLCKVIPFGYFKDRKHAMYCYLFSAMMACLLIAVIAPIVLYSLANDEINDQVVIDSTSAPNYPAWQNNVYGDGAEHIQISYNLYFFEVQNMADALNGARPKLMQVGPYAYDEYYVKFDITWTDGGDTVTYGTQKYYLFNPDKTGPGLTEDDQITLPYATLIGFEYLLSTIPVEAQELIDASIDGALKEQQLMLDGVINQLYYVVTHAHNLSIPEKVALRTKITTINSSVQILFDDIYSFVNRSDAGDLLLKTLMCKLGNLSPFWKVDPTRAWFGWLQDPLLTEVQQILYVVQNKSANGTVIPWTTAVPGAATNWTSVEDTRRRRQPDTFKTGKKNVNQVGQYVRYNNMTQLWACVVPMDSQNTSVYVDGEMFPACELFQYEWTDEEAYNKGYRKPFATSYANRIWGTDANAFGRPITGEKLAVFISDIYRSCFLQYQEDEDWNGVTTRRFHIQAKDLENATANPENAQFYAFGPSGLENTTAATGIPVFVSFPHFLHGDTRLVAAVEGLSPNVAEHESNLDMEPQTGLLTAAHKRLQVNYEMVDKIFPTTDPEDAKLAQQLCVNFTDIVQVLENRGLIPNITIPGCELTLFTELFTCWGTPVEWRMYDGQIFFPYGWVDESFQLPDSDADDINESLFFIEDLGKAVQFWSLVAAGILFTIILAMLYRGHLDMLARGQTVWHAYDVTSPAHHAALAASPATAYKRRNSRGEEITSDLHNPISEQRMGPGYMSKGATPFLQ